MLSMYIPAYRENLPIVLRFLRREAEAALVEKAELYKLELCGEEIFLNICSHAYSGNGGAAGIHVRHKDGLLTVCFEDTGPPFNPLEHTMPAVSLKPEQRMPGGLGIAMVLHYYPLAGYRRKCRKNLFWFSIARKGIEPQPVG